MRNLLATIDDLIRREKGYTNDPADKGGETNFGITEAVARANGYNGPMEHMPRITAQQIYLKKYWTEPGFMAIDDIFPELAEKLFDIGVNTGQERGIKWLQRCLNALNHNSEDYPDLVVDGNIGPKVLNALRAFITRRAGDDDEDVLLFMVAAQQSNYYLELSEKSPSQERFEYGWQAQRATFKSRKS